MKIMPPRPNVSTRNKIVKKLGIFVKNGVLEAADCATFVSLMRNGLAQKAEVYTSVETVGVNELIRKSLSVTLSGEAEARLDHIFRALRPELSKHFSVELGEHERPHYLLYQPGAFFAPHRDRPPVQSEISGRAVSVVLFLNEDYEGGQLNFFGLLGPGFDEVGLGCDPTAGTVLAFPSHLVHEVTPVTLGVRYSVVTWFPAASAAQLGGERQVTAG